MNTKLDLYIDLINALDVSELDYEQDDRQKSISVVALDEPDKWYTIEVYKDRYIGGTINYDDSNNFYSYSNIGCPEFDDVYDAIEWVVSN